MKKRKISIFLSGSGLRGHVVICGYHKRLLRPRNTRKKRKTGNPIFSKMPVLWSDSVLVVKNEISGSELVGRCVPVKIRDQKISWWTPLRLKKDLHSRARNFPSSLGNLTMKIYVHHLASFCHSFISSQSYS